MKKSRNQSNGMSEPESIEPRDMERYLRAPILEGLPEDTVVHTEGEPWKASRLGLLNAVMDTLHPGWRLVLISQRKKCVGIGMLEFKAASRPRNLAQSLRDLAVSIELAEQEKDAST